MKAAVVCPRCRPKRVPAQLASPVAKGVAETSAICSVGLRYQHRLADDGALLDQRETFDPVGKIESAGDGAAQLALGEPAHEDLLRFGHQGLSPRDRGSLARRRRGLAAPAVVVAEVET